MKKGKLQSNIFYEHRSKNAQQNAGKSNTIMYKKKVTHYDQMGIYSSRQGWLNISKSVNNMIHHINRIKKKNHMIIPTDTEKVFDKLKIPVHDKNF